MPATAHESCAALLADMVSFDTVNHHISGRPDAEADLARYLSDVARAAGLESRGQNGCGVKQRERCPGAIYTRLDTTSWNPFPVCRVIILLPDFPAKSVPAPEQSQPGITEVSVVLQGRLHTLEDCPD